MSAAKKKPLDLGDGSPEDAARIVRELMGSHAVMPPVTRPMGRNETMALAAYYRALPDREFKALNAWASTFYPFQREWLFEQKKFAICNKARRLGLSYTTGGLGVIWGAFHGEDTTIISRGEKESYEVLLLAKKHAETLRRLGSSYATTIAENKGEIQFASGGRIIALASTGGRGYTGNVFIDEFAYHQDAKGTWDGAAVAMTLGDARLRVSSTPNGIGNEFHNVYEQARKPGTKWALHEIPMGLAQAQGYPIDLEACWTLAKGDQRLFDQLFHCSFLDGDLQYIASKYIEACCFDDLDTCEGEYFAGLDIGRSVDLSVLVVVRVVKGVRVVQYVESMKRTDWDALEGMVDRAFARFKLKRLSVDATGIGTFPAEAIKKKHSERVDTKFRRPRVECVFFTPNSKEDLATNMYVAFTRNLVKLPSDDRALPLIMFEGMREAPGNKPGTAKRLRADVAAIRRIVTASNNIRYDAPHTDEGHADHAWALALALYAVGKPNAMVEAMASKS